MRSEQDPTHDRSSAPKRRAETPDCLGGAQIWRSVPRARQARMCRYVPADPRSVRSFWRDVLYCDHEHGSADMAPLAHGVPSSRGSAAEIRARLRILRHLRLSRTGGQPAKIALSQLVFGEAEVVGRRGARQGSLNRDDHDPADALACPDGPAGLVELDAAFEDVAVGVHGPGP